MSLKLAVTIDVEEEGLFSGSYGAGDCPVSNVPHLWRLDPVFRDLGIRPTLMTAYQVARREDLLDQLVELTEKWQGEIGGHLHPWNTPPIGDGSNPGPMPSDLMPEDLLSAKMDHLLEVLDKKGVRPTSFRMGRFNFGPKMLGILEKHDFLVDSSIAPMRRYFGGPDHLDAPSDPYFPDRTDPRRPGDSNVFEVPMTNMPLWPGLGRQLMMLERWPGIQKDWISWLAQNLASMSIQPMGGGPRRLKTAARLHRYRGGRVFTLFFHSSELMPGGCPRHRTDGQVQRFVDRLHEFLSWLTRVMKTRPVTLSELYPSLVRST